MKKGSVTIAPGAVTFFGFSKKVTELFCDALK